MEEEEEEVDAEEGQGEDGEEQARGKDGEGMCGFWRNDTLRNMSTKSLGFALGLDTKVAYFP